MIPKPAGVILKRALKKRCPQCGIGMMYRSWNKLVVTCPHCACTIEPRFGNSWFLMYLSTAFLTGLMVVAMILFPPENRVIGYIAVGIGWLVLIVFTLPYRKALAIALDYLIENPTGS